MIANCSGLRVRIAAAYIEDFNAREAFDKGCFGILFYRQERFISSYQG